MGALHGELVLGHLATVSGHGFVPADLYASSTDLAGVIEQLLDDGLAGVGGGQVNMVAAH